MTMLQPNAGLIIASSGRRCRLGLIARDDDNRFWGLTAAHMLMDIDATTICDAAGLSIGHYSRNENMFGLDAGDAASQIARFQLDPAAITPEKVNYGVTWPRDTIEDGTLLGTTIITIELAHRTIGTIVEIDSPAVIGFRSPDEPAIIGGVIIVALSDPAIVKPGHAGTLLLSEAGEAVALAIASQASEVGVELIGCPLRPFLERVGLRPWAPSGAHWTDLSHRVRRFLNLARAHPGPDLGDPPPHGRT